MNREPVLFGAAVVAVLTALQSFGVPLTGDQIGKVDAAVRAVTILAVALVVRSRVTPTDKQ